MKELNKLELHKDEMSNHIDLDRFRGNDGKVIWNNTIGEYISFKYNDIVGNIYITKHKGRHVNFIYKGSTYSITKSSLNNVAFGNMLGIKKKCHIYNVGEIVNGVKILIQNRNHREKAYVYECIKDGYVGEVVENSLKNGSSCPVCSNQKIVNGINSIYDTDRWMCKYIVNESDCYTLSHCTNKKIEMICPECGSKKKYSPACLYKHKSICCSSCSDGISVPNKFVYNVLSLSNYQLKTEEKIANKNYKYDILIDELKIVIENHGIQHYNQTTRKNSRTLENEKLNDKMKKCHAESNGYTYIEIDCRNSELEWIKNNLIKSGIIEMLKIKLEDINFKECFELSMKSRVVEVWDIWNNNKLNTTSDIVGITGLSRGTVISYLKRGKECGKCEYNPKEEMRKNGIRAKRNYKAVYCKELCMEFNSASHAVKYLSGLVKLYDSGISRCCYGKQKYCGSLSDGTMLTWEFIL